VPCADLDIKSEEQLVARNRYAHIQAAWQKAIIRDIHMPMSSTGSDCMDKME
jgi:hypothetical protein